MIYQKKTIKNTKLADWGWYALSAVSVIVVFCLVNRALTLAGY